MEEKSVEIPKIKGPLREQDSIRALLELLEQQGMEQEKGDVIRMADYIDSMEMLMCMKRSYPYLDQHNFH